MGNLGRITSLDDLPDDATIEACVRAVADLNERGIKPAKSKRPPEPLEIPAWFNEAIAANAAAKETFDAFSHTNRKEYVEWVTGARREETRRKRLATALEWMAQGKPRNWKYMNR